MDIEFVEEHEEEIRGHSYAINLFDYPHQIKSAKIKKINLPKHVSAE
jgi:hypothetical protein